MLLKSLGGNLASGSLDDQNFWLSLSPALSLAPVLVAVSPNELPVSSQTAT